MNASKENLDNIRIEKENMKKCRICRNDILEIPGGKKLIADIILGNNIDTLMWITELKENGADQIIVIDYNSSENYKEKGNIVYITPYYAIKYIQKFDSINFYKSLYAYPGMNGSMSSLYKRR